MSFGGKSARYNRINNTIDSKNQSITNQTSFAETVKLPTLNAINKSVKYNNLSFMTSRDLNKLRKEPEQSDNIEEESAHHNLMIIRKRYDHISKEKEELQKYVLELQGKKEKFLSQRNILQENKQDGKKKVGRMQQNLANMKIQVEEVEINRKVMLNIIQRIKWDKIVYDLRRYNYEKDLKYIKGQKEIILKESSAKMEEGDNTKRVFQKLISHLEAQKVERQDHLNNMNVMINQKTHLAGSVQLRKSQLIQIAENTLQDKDPKEKNWYKVYLCHKFVQRVLIAKVNREMMKFNDVQLAFKSIKLTTGVSDTQQMVKKFLNKEAAYGQLLSKITQDERQIVELKGAHEGLLKEKRALQGSNETLSSNKRNDQNLSKQEKEYHSISQKALRCTIMSAKLSQWFIKSIKKFNKLGNTSEDFSQGQAQLPALLNKYVEIMNKSLQNEQVAMGQQSYDNSVAVSSKNTRISYKGEDEQNKGNRNKTLSIDDQDDYVSNQRSQVIKANEKFMKDLKKKYEEIKKAILQAEPKKKEIVVQKPKAPVQQ